MDFLQHSRKEGKKFLNPVPTEISTGGNMLSIMWKYFTNREETIPKHVLGPFSTDIAVYKTMPASGLRITWIGHSSLLTEIDGRRILTDPVWSERASFSSFIGPKRFFAAPLSLNELPQLDAIIISHDHYDHLDKAVIEQLANITVPFYCSLGVGQYLEQWGVHKSRITEMDWIEDAFIGDDCTITALPARHFSGRSLRNRFQTLWSSFVIKASRHTIFYGADSGWFPGFKHIGNAYGPFDLTMLEIGAYNENWADIHMGPEKAVDAHLALKGDLMMPIHWGTFNLALHPWKEPIERLLQYAQEKNIKLFLPKPGEPTEVTSKSYNSKWWEQQKNNVES
ncbi:MAG TPA: MBL fold metallo-hydrolase [Chitinophagaceae bacterium]|nr:MBL fold metallo-hydrolase [Chitinophagaceae bacterium]